MTENIDVLGHSFSQEGALELFYLSVLLLPLTTRSHSNFLINKTKLIHLETFLIKAALKP